MTKYPDAEISISLHREIFIVIFFPLGLVLFNSFRYLLNAANHKRLRIQPDFQRGETEKGLDEEEAKDIRKKLIGSFFRPRPQRQIWLDQLSELIQLSSPFLTQL